MSIHTTIVVDRDGPVGKSDVVWKKHPAIEEKTGSSTIVFDLQQDESRETTDRFGRSRFVVNNPG
jgi:hypothetical protein